jgi:hypothetical protein
MERTARFLERSPPVISDTFLVNREKEQKGYVQREESRNETPHVGRADVSAQHHLDMVQALSFPITPQSVSTLAQRRPVLRVLVLRLS